MSPTNQALSGPDQALCSPDKALVRPPLKKSLFPVQRVAEIVASWAAAKLYFSPFFLFFGKKMMKFLPTIFWGGKMTKKVPILQ